jgi:hypothetical protein
MSHAYSKHTTSARHKLHTHTHTSMRVCAHTHAHTHTYTHLRAPCICPTVGSRLATHTLQYVNIHPHLHNHPHPTPRNARTRARAISSIHYISTLIKTTTSLFSSSAQRSLRCGPQASTTACTRSHDSTRCGTRPAQGFLQAKRRRETSRFVRLSRLQSRLL